MPSTPMDLFKGGRMGGLYNMTGGVGLSNANYDAAYSNCSIQCPGNPSSAFFNFYDPATIAPYVVMAGDFVSLRAFIQTGSFNGLSFALVDGSGRPVIAVTGNGSNNIFLSHNIGSIGSPNWQVLGSFFSYFNPVGGAVQPIDIRVDIAASGPHTATLIANDIEVGTATFTDATVTSDGIQGGQLNGVSGATICYSQIYARLNGTTVGAHVKTSQATGAGTYQEMAGTYTDVSQQIPNLINVNTSNATGQKQTYDMSTSLTVPAGYLIGGIDFWTQFKNDGTSPENLKTKLIIASTEYDASADLGSPGIGYTLGVQPYAVNPHTGVAWVQSDITAGIQAGWTSEA